MKCFELEIYLSWVIRDWIFFLEDVFAVFRFVPRHWKVREHKNSRRT